MFMCRRGFGADPAISTVLGIDPGYGDCGWALMNLNHAVIDCGSVTTPQDLHWLERLALVEEMLMGIHQDGSRMAVAIEGYDFYRTRSKEHTTPVNHGFVMGAVWTMYRNLFEVALYQPTEGKWAICGTTKADKKLVALTLERRLNWKGKNSHIRDAALQAELHLTFRQQALATLGDKLSGEVKIITKKGR